jgi:hypothetical protein
MADPLSLTQAIIDGAREVFGWWTDEAGRIEAQKRSALRDKKKECQRALSENRLADLRRLSAEYERLSDQA